MTCDQNGADVVLVFGGGDDAVAAGAWLAADASPWLGENTTVLRHRRRVPLLNELMVGRIADVAVWKDTVVILFVGCVFVTEIVVVVVVALR